MDELNFTFSMPDEESLAKYISIKGEKGDGAGATKTSELVNDSDFTTNAALTAGLATKADDSTVQSLTTQVNANTNSLQQINATQIQIADGNGTTVYYYELCELEGYTNGTSAVNIHGRIGAYYLDVDQVDFTFIASMGLIGAKGDYYTTTTKNNRDVNFVVYYDENTEVAKLYMVGKRWFYTNFTIAVSGATTQTYDGTYSSTTPSGTLLWSFQDDSDIQINYNGVIHGDIDGNAATVGGHSVNTDVPFNAVFTDTVYDDAALQAEVDLKANVADVAEVYATKAELQSVVSASPTPVSSTSEMTDTTKIYVNTTDGYWYYYDGSEWVQGGVYQASEDSTAVEGLVFNQKNENLKYQFNFAVGNVNQSTGAFLPSSSGYKVNLATPDIQQFSYDLFIPYNDYVRSDLFFFNNDGTFASWQVAANNTKGYKIKAGTKFRIRLHYNTVPSPLPDLTQDTVENSLLFQNYVVMPFSIYKEKQLDKLRTNGYQEDFENLKYYLDIEIGDINAAGIDRSINANRRLCTPNVLNYDFDVVIPKTNLFMVYLWTYSDATGAGATGRGWLPLTTADYTIAAGTYFRLLFVSSSSSTTPIYDIYDNAVFVAFKLYKKIESATANVIQYNPNMRSVAHQGYSTTSQTYGNCRLSSYIGAKKHGFDYGECDIKWSSDGIPVCCHDATFVSNGTTITIADHTLAELKTYTYYGEVIASFEEVLSKCKELGLGLYIDHLNGGWTDTQWNTLFALVNKHQMQNNVYWLQGISRNVTNKILSWYDRAKIVFVVSANNLTSVITEANAVKTNFNEVFIDFDYSQITVEQLKTYIAQTATGVQFEIWIVDDATTYKNYLPYVCGITSNKICYNDVYEDLLS